MKIETYIDSLISYAMNKGLALPEDHTVLLNRILEILHLDSYEPSDEPQAEELEEILNGLLDYACQAGICEDNVVARDLFDTKLMGALTPLPREVIATFRALYEKSPEGFPELYNNTNGKPFGVFLFFFL